MTRNPFWLKPGFTFALQPVWPPMFESRIDPPDRTEKSRAVMAEKKRNQRAAAVAAGGDPTEPPVHRRGAAR